MSNDECFPLLKANTKASFSVLADDLWNTYFFRVDGDSLVNLINFSLS